MNEGDATTRLNRTISQTPIIFEGDPIFLAELDNISVEKNLKEYVYRVDSPSPLPVERTIILGPVSNYYDRWPRIKPTKKSPTDLSQFNKSFFKNFDQVQKYAFTQTDVAAKIEEDLNADVIVLLLIDGLRL